MAAKFGFRVFTFQVGKRQRWKKSEALGDLSGTYPQRVYDLLLKMKGEVLRYRPNLSDPRGEVPIPLVDEGAPVLVVKSVTKVGRTVSVEVVSGQFGSHEDLVGADVEPIGKRAAGRRYRVAFLFPLRGNAGMIVAEVRQRHTPLLDLLRWLAREDALRLTDDSSEEDWWRTMRPAQVADRAYLEHLVLTAKKVQVKFGLAQFSTRGRRREIERELAIRSIDNEQIGDVAEEILRWTAGRRQGAVSRTLRVVGLDPDKLRLASLDFNNTTVHIDTESDESLSVDPVTVKDLFTYPIAHDVRPDEERWVDAARPKAAQLAEIEGIEVEWE